MHSWVSHRGGEKLDPTTAFMHDVYPDVLGFQHQVSQLKNNVVNTLPSDGVHYVNTAHGVYPGVLDSRQQVSRSQNSVSDTLHVGTTSPVERDHNLVLRGGLAQNQREPVGGTKHSRQTIRHSATRSNG